MSSEERFYIQHLNSLGEWVYVRGASTKQTFMWFHRFDRANARMQEEAVSRPDVPHRVIVRKGGGVAFETVGAHFCVSAKVGLP